MGLLSSPASEAANKRVHHIRCDRIGNAGGRELWWVALAYEDESTKPSGMYGDFESARKLADELAVTWKVDVVVTHVV